MTRLYNVLEGLIHKLRSRGVIYRALTLTSKFLRHFLR